MLLLLSCRLALVAASLALPAAGGKRVPAARPVTAADASPPRVLPTKHYLRVNDTLVLVVSRPYTTFTTFTTSGRETPTWLWQRAELRGRRSYRQRLDDGSGSGSDFVTLYGARAGAGGTLLRLSYWRDPHQLPPRHPAPHNLDDNDAAFACLVWDVRYRTWGWFYDANLRELDAQSDETPAGFNNTAFGFIGGHYEDYYEWGVFTCCPTGWRPSKPACAAPTACPRPPDRLPGAGRKAFPT